MIYCANIIGSLLKEILNLVTFFTFYIFYLIFLALPFLMFSLNFRVFLVPSFFIFYFDFWISMISTFFIYQLHFRIFLICYFLILCYNWHSIFCLMDFLSLSYRLSLACLHFFLVIIIYIFLASKSLCCFADTGSIFTAHLIAFLVLIAQWTFINWTWK